MTALTWKGAGATGSAPAVGPGVEAGIDGSGGAAEGGGRVTVKRVSNGASAALFAAGSLGAMGAALLNTSSGGAALGNSRIGSRLTRNTANMPNPQLIPRIEAMIATIINRRFGNIGPRRTLARCRNSHASHSSLVIARADSPHQRRPPSTARLAESLVSQGKKSESFVESTSSTF